MKKQRILVVSSANIDFVQRMRRMPYSGETVCEPELGYSYVPGGKGANSAVAFARMGADCVFQCKLGRDSNAKRLISFYQREEWRVKSEDSETVSLSLHSAISTLHFFYITLSPSGSVNNSLSGVSVLSSLTVTLRVSVSPS